MFRRIYLIKFAFLLTVVQLAVAVYLLVIGIGDGMFYDKMFFYTMFLSLVPFIFGVIILSFPSQTNTYLDQSNGFVNQNSIKKEKSSEINETAVQLFALGLLFLFYNILFKLLSLPNWIIIIIPLFLSLLIFKSNQKYQIIDES